MEVQLLALPPFKYQIYATTLLKVPMKQFCKWRMVVHESFRVPNQSMTDLVNALKNGISEPMNSRELYKRLAIVVVEVRQGQSGVSPPLKKFTKRERKELNKKKFEFHSLNFEHLDNALWIKSTLGEDSTIVGNKILKIDEEPIDTLISEYKQYFASDGYNTTFFDKNCL